MFSFYVREPLWMRFDRFYKVYVDDIALHGAWLAGEIYDDASSECYLSAAQFLAPLVSLWFKRLIRERWEREEQYDQINPSSPDFLKRDIRNFEIVRRDVLRIEVNERRWSFWVNTRVTGILRITTRVSGTRKFILVGEQDASLIRASLNGDS